MLQTLSYIINVAPEGVPQVVRLSQNENGRTLSFTLTGAGTVNIPSGSTVTISGTKPDGVVYSQTGTISGTTASFPETTQMTAVSGIWPAKIKVTYNGETIATCKIVIAIDPDPVAPGSVPSSSQLNGLVAEAQQYATYAKYEAFGSPLVAATAAAMTDKTRVYVYTGSETGKTAGHWYYWNGSAWTDGGVYNSQGINTDTTFTISGMAADSGAVGAEFTHVKQDISKCVMFPHTENVAHTDTANALFSSTSMSASTFSGFSYTIVNVNPGETYNVSGYGSSSPYKPFFASDSEALLEFDLENNATAPAGTTRLIVNGRPAAGLNISIRRYITTDGSEELINNVTPVSVSFDNSGNCHVIQANYADETDFETDITIKSGNNLPDIYGFYKINKNTGVKTAITEGTTDFLSPSVVYAVNNANGDFPDFTSGKLTGGWHRYNSSTTTGTATARNLLYKVYCDGKEVTAGTSAKGKTVLVEIVNRLQASNTEKSDGTGREVVQQRFTLKFDGNTHGCEVLGEITALEDIKYDTYYGVSTYYSQSNGVYFVGCRDKRGSQVVSDTPVRCGDKYCTSALQILANDYYEMGIDPTLDLGQFYANAWTNSCIMSTKKSYMVLIYANNTDSNRLSLPNGAKAYWKGFYRCAPNPQ